MSISTSESSTAAGQLASLDDVRHCKMYKFLYTCMAAWFAKLKQRLEFYQTVNFSQINALVHFSTLLVDKCALFQNR